MGRSAPWGVPGGDMNLDVLTYPAENIPPGVAAEVWVSWIKGTRAYDEIWGAGARCPTSHGAACTCKQPREKLCRIWARLVEIAREIPDALAIIQAIETDPAACSQPPGSSTLISPPG